MNLDDFVKGVVRETRYMTNKEWGYHWEAVIKVICCRKVVDGKVKSIMVSYIKSTLRMRKSYRKLNLILDLNSEVIELVTFFII